MFWIFNKGTGVYSNIPEDSTFYMGTRAPFNIDCCCNFLGNFKKDVFFY